MPNNPLDPNSVYYSFFAKMGDGRIQKLHDPLKKNLGDFEFPSREEASDMAATFSRTTGYTIHLMETRFHCIEIYNPDGLVAMEKQPPTTPIRLERGMDYEDDCFCDHCQKITPHLIHSNGHERDSSYDWQECKVCHWRQWGMMGEYEPPLEEKQTPPLFPDLTKEERNKKILEAALSRVPNGANLVKVDVPETDDEWVDVSYRFNGAVHRVSYQVKRLCPS
jgi:hypothetical protein